MTKLNNNKPGRIRQGDIFKDVEAIEHAYEKEGNIEISVINFPLVYTLTQDCDLNSDHLGRNSAPEKFSQRLLSVIVCPIYNYDHVINGEHLELIDFNLDSFTKRQKELLPKNEILRYHFLNFQGYSSIIEKAVIDFKHYFTVQTEYLIDNYNDKFLYSVDELFREDVSQRFSAYLSRIGLP